MNLRSEIKINIKQQKKILVGLAFLGFGAGIILTASELFLLCDKLEYSCRSYYSSFGQPVGVMSLAVLISLVPLCYTRESIYKSWRTFALISLPLIILGIYASPQYGEGGMSGIGSPLGDRESFTMFFSVLFVIISYILIILKTIRAKKE